MKRVLLSVRDQQGHVSKKLIHVADHRPSQFRVSGDVEVSVQVTDDAPMQGDPPVLSYLRVQDHVVIKSGDEELLLIGREVDAPASMVTISSVDWVSADKAVGAGFESTLTNDAA